MHIWVPKTMTGMVTAGCLLASVPLLVALVWSAAVLNRFGERSEHLAKEGLVMASLSTELRHEIGNVERQVRQYAVLRDPALLEVVHGRLARAGQTLDALGATGADPDFGRAVAAVREALTGLQKQWRNAPDTTRFEALVATVATVDGQSRELVELGRQRMTRQLLRLQAAAGAAQRVILAAVLALIPTTGVLAYGFSLLITRPLRRMNHAISSLGHARYREPVAIGYPHEMRRLGERLDWLRLRLSSLELDKDRFLRHVSHELKTPLASLQEGCALLLEGRLGTLAPRQNEVVRILCEASDELSGLIGNLLAYAEWRRGNRSPAITRFAAQALFDEVRQSQQLGLRRKQLTLDTTVSLEQLGGQRAALRVALENLVSNAVKHAPEGSRIELASRRRDDCCELSVRDFGAGVPEHERERIFEAFVRGSEAEESGVRGTGIGLSIVREAVQAHGGTVEVEDAAPGARFLLRWPMAVPHA